MKIFMAVKSEISVYYWDGETEPGFDADIPQWLFRAIESGNVKYIGGKYIVEHKQHIERLENEGYIYRDINGNIGILSEEYFRECCTVEY